MLVVDSSVWIDFFNARNSVARHELRRLLHDGHARLVVPDLVLYEVLRGFREERALRREHCIRDDNVCLVFDDLDRAGGQTNDGRVKLLVLAVACGLTVGFSGGAVPQAHASDQIGVYAKIGKVIVNGSQVTICGAFRVANTDGDEFSWWPSGTLGKGDGWRTDTQLVSRDLVRTVEYAAIYKSKAFSSHAPVIVDYDIMDM